VRSAIGREVWIDVPSRCQLRQAAVAAIADCHPTGAQACRNVGWTEERIATRFVDDAGAMIAFPSGVVVNHGHAPAGIFSPRAIREGKQIVMVTWSGRAPDHFSLGSRRAGVFMSRYGISRLIPRCGLARSCGFPSSPRQGTDNCRCSRRNRLGI